MSDFKCSDEAVQMVDDYEKANTAFKTAWEQFETAHQAELDHLDKLREDRNSKLDSAKRKLREEAEEADITTVKTFRVGPFQVSKKWSNFYSPEKLVSGLKANGLYDKAITGKVVAEKIEIEKYEMVKQFLTLMGVEKEFEDCEDGKELSPAVTAPKPIPAFGAEVKEK